jgi:hypothetical protein
MEGGKEGRNVIERGAYLQELTLTEARVPDKEHVDISADAKFGCALFWCAATRVRMEDGVGCEKNGRRWRKGGWAGGWEGERAEGREGGRAGGQAGGQDYLNMVKANPAFTR